MKEPRLNDAINLFAQKFVAMGENRNFTLSTLTDMTWTVLVVMWEAVASGKVQPLGNNEVAFLQKKYEELMKRFVESRSQYLSELAALRDDKRQAHWNPHLQEAFNQLCPEEPIYKFVPEDAMDPEHRKFFKDAMEETVKLALIQGARSQMQNMEDLAKDIAEDANAKAELQTLLEQAEEARRKAQDLLDIERETVKKLTQAGGGVVETLQDEVTALKNELKQAKHREDNMREQMSDLRKEFAGDSRSNRPATTEHADAQSQQMHSLQKQMEELQRRAAEAQERATKAEAQVTKEKNAAEARAAAGASAADAATVKDAKMVQLEHKLSSSEAEIERLKEELAQFRESERNSLANQAAKASEPKDKKVKDDKPTKDAESVKKMNQQLQKERTERQEEVEKLKKRMALLEADLEKEKKELQVQRKKALALAGKEGQDGELTPDDLALPATQHEIELEEELKVVKERETNLLAEIQNMGAELASANDTQKKLEAMIQEMKLKFADLEEVLRKKGVDVEAVREALAEVGISQVLSKELSGMNVFERLYLDAMKRIERAIQMQQRFRDLQQAELLHVLHVVHHSPYTEETSMLYTAFYRALDVSDVGSKALNLTRSGQQLLSSWQRRQGATMAATDLSARRPASRAGAEDGSGLVHRANIPDSALMQSGKPGHPSYRPQSTPCSSGGFYVNTGMDPEIRSSSPGTRRRSPSPTGRPSTDPGRARSQADLGLSSRRFIIEQSESLDIDTGFTCRSFVPAGPGETSLPSSQEEASGKEQDNVEEVPKSNQEPFPVHVVKEPFPVHVVTVQPLGKQPLEKQHARRLVPVARPGSPGDGASQLNMSSSADLMGSQVDRMPKEDLIVQSKDRLDVSLPKNSVRIHEFAGMSTFSVLQRPHQRPRTEGQMQLLGVLLHGNRPASSGTCRREPSPPRFESAEGDSFRRRDPSPLQVQVAGPTDSAVQAVGSRVHPSQSIHSGQHSKSKRLNMPMTGNGSLLMEEQGDALVLGRSVVRPGTVKQQGRKQQQRQLSPSQQEQHFQNLSNQAPTLRGLVQEDGPQPGGRSLQPSLAGSQSLPQLSAIPSGQKLVKDSSSSWLPKASQSSHGQKSPPSQRPLTVPKKVEIWSTYPMDTQPLRVSRAGQRE